MEFENRLTVLYGTLNDMLQTNDSIATIAKRHGGSYSPINDYLFRNYGLNPKRFRNHYSTLFATTGMSYRHMRTHPPVPIRSAPDAEKIVFDLRESVGGTLPDNAIVTNLIVHAREFSISRTDGTGELSIAEGTYGEFSACLLEPIFGRHSDKPNNDIPNQTIIREEINHNTYDRGYRIEISLNDNKVTIRAFDLFNKHGRPAALITGTFDVRVEYVYPVDGDESS